MSNLTIEDQEYVMIDQLFFPLIYSDADEKWYFLDKKGINVYNHTENVGDRFIRSMTKDEFVAAVRDVCVQLANGI